MTDPEMPSWLRKEITDDRDYAAACLARPIFGTDFDAIHERIARCEAELGILDEHGPYTGTLPRMSGCKTCMREEGDNFWPCRTVALLAAGYRHRPGWKTEWGS